MVWRRRIVRAALVANTLLVAACCSLTLPEERIACFDNPRVCADPSMFALAADLDQLEVHLDACGSIVAKQPDVWGQARLTQQRQEFEMEMAKELDRFGVKLSGALQRTDQAYLANAMALSAALPPGLSPLAGALAPTPGVVLTERTTKTSSPGDPAKGIAAKEMSQVEKLPPPSPLVPKDLVDPKLLVPPPEAAAARETLLPKPLAIAGQEQGVTLEPTLYLDQKSRYLAHLAELRRINEGDDTADSPGYGLALIRIPVSVLPGRQTAFGCGAEITFTLSPNLSEDLLPTTFRNLVMNDLAKQLGYPLTKAVNDPNLAPALAVDRVRETQRRIKEETANIDAVFARWAEQAESAMKAEDWGKVKQEHASRVRPALLHPAELMALSAASSAEAKQRGKDAVMKGLSERCEAQKSDKRAFLKKHAADRLRAELEASIRSVVITPTSNRHSRLPFPPSQAMDLYGAEYVYRIGYAAYQAFAKEIAAKGSVHLPDVQSFLQEELNSAYRFLANSNHASLWELCTPELAEAVAARRFDVVEQVREEFQQRLRNQMLGLTPDQTEEAVDCSVTPALVWAILVDSALLNARLTEDMKQTAIARNCPQCYLGWQPFFAPQPPLEARLAFNEYVRCRWPVHVFALDPITQDQNLADAARTRREMQLALAMGFVTGNISAQNLARWSRRLEADAETIALNRTIVSFAHGPNAFGWRFYPRYQTPEPESACAAWWNGICKGKTGHERLMGQRLEPGPRECVALAIVPSFVPSACLEAQSRWFDLASPERLVQSHREALRLSSAVKGIQECAGQVRDADCFRDGELSRLLTRCKQLEARLPSQSLRVPVPYENTLGGFEMFNTGITDLTPELVGFYGQPGILGERETVLFLMGDHFSMNHTQAVAGGQSLKVELLSRQVLRATVPPGCSAVNGKVEVHVATPYGVSRALEIPLILARNEAKPGPTTSAPSPSGGVGLIQPAAATAPRELHRPPPKAPPGPQPSSPTTAGAAPKLPTPTRPHPTSTKPAPVPSAPLPKPTPEPPQLPVSWLLFEKKLSDLRLEDLKPLLPPPPPPPDLPPKK